MNKETLVLKKNGKLSQIKWVYDEEKGEGAYQEFDVSSNPISYIRDICHIEDGATLKDLFLLIRPQKELFQLVFENWLQEYVEYGLNNIGKIDDGYNPDDIEYLELYWDPHFDSKSLYGHTRPSFHGIGYELREDYYGYSSPAQGPQWSKGSRVNWGLMGSDLLSYINKPLRLNKELVIYNSDLDAEDWGHELARYSDPEYTLFNIIEGIFWEISYNGGIEDTLKFEQELKEIIKELKVDKPENT